MQPLMLASFGMHVVDRIEKHGFNAGDVLTSPEVLGALSGGVLGGMTGDVLTREEENRWRNRLIGALMGAALGGGGAHLLAGGERAPSAKPSSAAPAGSGELLPTSSTPSGEARVPAASVEPALRGSEQAVRQRIAQEAAQQAVQFSAARERAELLRDQGRVNARLQQLLAPVRPSSGNGHLKSVPRPLRAPGGHIQILLRRRYPPGAFPKGPSK